VRELALERITRFSPAAIATFRCVAPARCGAFADERRIVAATRADVCGREAFIPTLK
jgi:hypothetical protein